MPVIVDPDTLFDPQTPMAELLRRAVAEHHGIPAKDVTHRLVHDFMAAERSLSGVNQDG